MTTPETNVTYTVKEMLAKIEGKIDGVIITIGQKADKHDVETLGGRVAALEDAHSKAEQDRLTAIEVAATLAAKKKADQTWWEHWRVRIAWLLGSLVAVAQIHQAFPHFHF